MTSSRVLICDLCIIMLFGLNFALAEVNAVSASHEDLKGNCSCGGFSSRTIDGKDEPLLSEIPDSMVKCDVEGETVCKNLCHGLATATKAKGPEALCLKLKTAHELKLSAFFKLCEMSWTYADMTAEEALCCEDSKVKTCPSAEKNKTA